MRTRGPNGIKSRSNHHLEHLISLQRPTAFSTSIIRLITDTIKKNIAPEVILNISLIIVSKTVFQIKFVVKKLNLPILPSNEKGDLINFSIVLYAILWTNPDINQPVIISRDAIIS